MTINSKHTVHELSELLDNLDGFARSMRDLVSRGDWATWSSNDPAGADDWRRDWDSFSARWALASGAAHRTVADGLANLRGWDLTTDEPAYQVLLRAFKPSDGDPTSFDDLDRRWRVAQAKGAPPAPVYVTTQPTAPDADLGAYQAADAGVKLVQAVAQQAAAAAGEAAKGLTPSTGTLIVGGIAIAVLLGIALKVAK
jgi:hypothetical protein